ncbi:unnamed protein product, partial [Rotaria magnacalcarata]
MFKKNKNLDRSKSRSSTSGALTIISLIYISIVRFIRQSTLAQRARQNSNKRDLLVAKRIVLLFTATRIGLPTGFLLIVYMITNNFDLTHLLHS